MTAQTTMAAMVAAMQRGGYLKMRVYQLSHYWITLTIII